jgi:natural product precursor
MKKQIKKLTLSRETLRSLEEEGLAPVVGGTAGCIYETRMECTIMNCSEKCFVDPASVRCY